MAERTVAAKKRLAGTRLALEPLESRELLTVAPTFSSALFLASAQARDAAASAQVAVPFSPSAGSIVAQPLATSGSAPIHHAPSGADKDVATLEDSAYTFAINDFGFSDPDDLSSPAPAVSNLTAANVLVLYNTASAEGTQIANYYAQVHPGVQLLGLNGVDPNNEEITADDYLSTIRPQVVAALTPAIEVIVTTKGLPLRINVTEPALPAFSTYVDSSGTTRTVFAWRQYSSLESELTRVDSVSMWQMIGDQTYFNSGHFAWNTYFLSDAPFSHATYGTRLTSRLDGYTVGDVLASIDRAQQAFIGPQNSPGGPIFFLVDDDPSKNYGFSMDDLVNNVLTPMGMPVVYDNTSAFVGTAPGPVVGYDSHGVHQASTPANYLQSGLNVTLADGAVFASWESFNAYSFKPASNPHINQGQVGQWLQIGGTAAVGHVEEPQTSPNNVTHEDQMFQMLLAGYTFAEAAWSATPQLSFVNTVVGDPLMTWQPLSSAGADSLLAVEITTLPTAGTLTNNGLAVAAGQFVSAADIAAGRLKFTPAANANGSNYASFTFQVQDDGGTAGGGSDLDPSPNVIRVSVTAVNDPPVGANKTVTTLEDAAYIFAAADFSFSDTADSPADALSAVKITTLPTAGTLTNNGLVVSAGQFIAVADIMAGKLKFTPAVNARGVNYANFTFQVQDNGGTAAGGIALASSPDMLMINVTSVNDPPTGTNKTVTTLENAAYTFAVADFGFGDPADSPANSLLSVKLASLPSVGALTNNNQAVSAGQFISAVDIAAGKLMFAPAANGSGVNYANFTFQVRDNGGTANGGIDLDPAVDVIMVNVTAANNPPADTTPPTVTVLSPANGASNVAIQATATVTFSEAMTASTVNAGTVLLMDGASAVPAGVSYNAANNSATLTPSSALANSKTYTIVVKGGSAGVKDTAGNALAADATASFTTVAQVTTASLWTPSVIPAIVDSLDGNAVELGVKFTSDVDGYITGLRFYKSAANTGTHVGSLFTTNGQRLATATFTNETASGWQQVNFAAPIAITAGTTYLASYHTNVGRYSVSRLYFSSAYTNGPLHVAPDGGVYLYGAGGFPTKTFQGSNYWVDVVLSTTPPADTFAPTVTAFSPASGVVGVATSAAATITFSEALNPSTVNAGTVSLHDANNTVVATTISYNSATNRVTVTATSPLSNSTTYSILVKGGSAGVTDMAGNALGSDATSSFTTIAAISAPVSLWNNSTMPAIIDVNDGQALELGTKFISDVNGTITGARFYKSATNTGTHAASLWTAAGQLLATTTFTNESASGWQQVNFAAPIAISAGTTYVVSYHTNVGHYSLTRPYFSSQFNSGYLHVPANGGVYRYGTGGFPTQTFQASNYWVDVLFVPAAS